MLKHFAYSGLARWSRKKNGQKHWTTNRLILPHPLPPPTTHQTVVERGTRNRPKELNLASVSGALLHVVGLQSSSFLYKKEEEERKCQLPQTQSNTEGCHFCIKRRGWKKKKKKKKSTIGLAQEIALLQRVKHLFFKKNFHLGKNAKRLKENLISQFMWSN